MVGLYPTIKLIGQKFKWNVASSCFYFFALSLRKMFGNKGFAIRF
jgi:hypothetical protein